MPRPEKVAVVEEIRTKLADADAAVLTEYRGLTVPELASLRASLRGTGTEYKVFKNTLARRAVADSDLDDIAAMFEGPVAIAFVRGDAASAAKALREFGRTNPALVVKGGLLGERIISSVEIETLAELPTRDVLLSTVAGAFQAPLAKAAGLFQAFTRNFAYGLKALIDVRGGAPAEAESTEVAAAEPEPEPEPSEPAAEADATAVATEESSKSESSDSESSDSESGESESGESE
jgi:large subunit ribosomal protein L10